MFLNPLSSLVGRGLIGAGAGHLILLLELLIGKAIDLGGEAILGFYNCYSELF